LGGSNSSRCKKIRMDREEKLSLKSRLVSRELVKRGEWKTHPKGVGKAAGIV